MYNKVGWRLGKTLDGRYEILSVLGIGGMAIVYKAFDHKLKRNVAIKVLRDDVAMDAQSRRRFRTEYQAVGMLSHPNIRAVYDVVSSGDTEYIVMEYVDGINLKQYLKKKGVLSWKEALHFSTQIAKALSHAHSKGIIHMDIKPQNIILPKDGTAKVADFGIAQLEEGENENSSNSEEAVGSIHYISPEQARGEAVDARSDIYSLGVVMYEMFTGKLPFDGDSVAEVAVKHFTVTPPAPSSLNPEIPPELEEITLRAMQPDPNDRYQSADELLADLEDFRKGQTAAIGDVVRKALAEESVHRQAAAADEIHVVVKNVPRISKAGELSKEGYVRRRTRANRISTLLGFAIVILFALGLFSFVWNYWLEGIFQDAERMNVPSFVGQTLESIVEDESMTELFNFTTVYKADASTPAGTIIDQSPAAQSSRMIVPEGIKVTLTVSSGVQLVTVPDEINQPYNEAQVALQSLGLNVEIELVASDSVTANYIISMDPQPGSSISSGSTIELVVSAGPTVTYVTVPDVVGMEKTQALLEVQQQGLVCAESEITYISSTEEEKGLVLWQNYASGTSVVTGTKLYLQIGSGPAGQ
jgi:serine/threonine-protein kinase